MFEWTKARNGHTITLEIVVICIFGIYLIVTFTFRENVDVTIFCSVCAVVASVCAVVDLKWFSTNGTGYGTVCTLGYVTTVLAVLSTIGFIVTLFLSLGFLITGDISEFVLSFFAVTFGTGSLLALSAKHFKILRQLDRPALQVVTSNSVQEEITIQDNYIEPTEEEQIEQTELDQLPPSYSDIFNEQLQVQPPSYQEITQQPPRSIFTSFGQPIRY